MKRFICLLISLSLLMAGGQVLAAAAGSAGDPLVSQSYADGKYTTAILNEARLMLDNSLKRVLAKALPIINGEGLGTGRFSVDSLPAGEKINLRMGGSVVLLSGSARLDISYGAVVNVTTGREVDSGGLLLSYNRYMAAEGSSATVTLLSEASVAMDGDALTGEARATFSDVPSGHWAFNAVEAMAQLGIVNGRGGGIFDPSSNMTRADFVTVTGRYHGADSSAAKESAFSDVPNGMYYTPYTAWAADAGIVSGYGGGLFGPGDNITRAQMARVIVSYAEYAGISLPDSGDRSKFADDGAIPTWASEYVYKARNAGLINGKGNNLFDPSGLATRAEVCMVIFRLGGF